jgi:metal-responsive CopG/Arc/MetJ family transcriptional regulator
MKQNATFAIDSELLDKFNKIVERKSTGSNRIIKSAIVEKAIREFVERVK